MEWNFGLKSMSGNGVIVYINDMKVGLGTFRILSLYGPGPKKNPLVPPHRMAAHPVNHRLNRLKVGALITNIMLSRKVTHCVTITYVLLFSSICTVLLSCNNILGLIISIAIWLRLPSIFDSIFWVGKPI